MKDALGHGSDARGAAGAAGDAAHQRGIAEALRSKQDGTFDQYGRTPAQGFMVGGAAHSRYTGAWTDSASGKRYVEKSNRVNSEVLARSMGRMRNQIAVWDLGRQREIKTGGNGNWKPR